MMRWGVIIVAAGKGRRFGRPKQLVDLAGRPLVAWSLATFASMPEIAMLALVVDEAARPSFTHVFDGNLRGKRGLLVPGGMTRQESVYAGLRALQGEVDAVVVHDGARPLVRADDARRCMRVVAPGMASCLAAPVVDTIKAVDEHGHVRRTLDRTTLWAAQTPQCAMYADIERAYREAGREVFEATDDAGVMEHAGIEVSVIPGTAENFKITTPADLTVAQAIVRERKPMLPDEEEMYFLEAFVPTHVVEAIINEVEANDGDLDGIDRELPQGVAVRAYLPGSNIERFRARFHIVAGHDATYTTRFSHGANRG